jgi:hypothetical protein
MSLKNKLNSRNKQTHQLKFKKWVEIFESFKNKTITHTNLLKVVKLGLCFPGNNAQTEIMFSLMNILRDKNRMQMNIKH